MRSLYYPAGQNHKSHKFNRADEPRWSGDTSFDKSARRAKVESWMNGVTGLWTCWMRDETGSLTRWSKYWGSAESRFPFLFSRWIIAAAFTSSSTLGNPDLWTRDISSATEAPTTDVCCSIAPTELIYCVNPKDLTGILCRSRCWLSNGHRNCQESRKFQFNLHINLSRLIRSDKTIDRISCNIF